MEELRLYEPIKRLTDMIDNNLILYLPFDDPDGSKAYDFSLSRADATLSDGATFSKIAKSGKSLSMNGAGECQTDKAIPLSGDFTLCCYCLLYISPSPRD